MRRAWVEAIHSDQLRQHGGLLGVRDDNVIESGLHRPRNQWAHGDERDLAGLAAAYGFGLARNRGFADGNKRTAFQTMYTFLGLNGQNLVAPEAEVVEVMIEIRKGARAEAELATWIRGRVQPDEG